jgi:hypothetical protein
MKRSIARKWAAALESGEYQQTKGVLRDPNGFCCLGVLCNIHAQENPEIAAKESDPDSYLGEVEVIPYQVQDWAGLSSVDGSLTTSATGDIMLAEENDKGMKFPQIAKIIRKHWKEL